ncbi:hypothetical protein, partial [uncultured Ruminococcus sp.]|uniref:hypothetical protein n=1 Tax=uncultured Ruminococcus sp. TaxID=165186 RepID=UPI00266D8BA2
ISAGISSFFGSPHFNTYTKKEIFLRKALTENRKCAILESPHCMRLIFCTNSGLAVRFAVKTLMRILREAKEPEDC